MSRVPLTKRTIAGSLTAKGGSTMRPPGPWEIGLILVIVLVIFGAGKLPQVFRSAGQGLREFRKAREGELDEEKETSKTSSKPARKK